MLLGQPTSPGRQTNGKSTYLPSAVHAIIRKATHPDPRERFPNAVTMQKAWQQVSILSPDAPPQSVQPLQGAAPDPSAGTRLRGKASLIEMPLLLLVLALVIAAGFALQLKRRGDAPSMSPAPATQTAPGDEELSDRIENAGDRAETVASAEATDEEAPLEDSMALPAEDAEKDEHAYVKAALREQMEGYYAALRAKDAETLLQYFHPPLQRFFNERNVTETQLRAFLRQSWQRTPEARHNIIWSTMRYGQDEAGNHVADYWMYYHYRRANRDGWRKQIVFTRLKLDQDLKIIAMNGH
jgi:hypothetical protein